MGVMVSANLVRLMQDCLARSGQRVADGGGANRPRHPVFSRLKVFEGGLAVR